MEASSNLTNVSSVARESWTLYLRHARIFVGYSAWLLVPMALSVLFSLAFSADQTIPIIQTINGTLGLIISIWISIVIISIIPSLRAKKRLRPRAVSKRAWTLFLSYLFLAIIINILTGVGLLFLILPGLLVVVRLSYAQIILVREKIDPLTALRASVQRTKGKTWLLLKRLIGGLITIGIPYAFFALSLTIAMASVRGLDPFTFFFYTDPTLLEILLFQVLDILFLPIYLIYWVLMFDDVQG